MLHGCLGGPCRRGSRVKHLHREESLGNPLDRRVRPSACDHPNDHGGGRPLDRACVRERAPGPLLTLVEVGLRGRQRPGRHADAQKMVSPGSGPPSPSFSVAALDGPPHRRADAACRRRASSDPVVSEGRRPLHPEPGSRDCGRCRCRPPTPAAGQDCPKGERSGGTDRTSRSRQRLNHQAGRNVLRLCGGHDDADGQSGGRCWSPRSRSAAHMPRWRRSSTCGALSARSCGGTTTRRPDVGAGGAGCRPAVVAGATEYRG